MVGKSRWQQFRKIIPTVLAICGLIVVIIALLKSKDHFLIGTAAVTIGLGTGLYLRAQYLQKNHRLGQLERFLKVANRTFKILFLTMFFFFGVAILIFKISSSWSLYFWYPVCGVALLWEGVYLYNFFRID